MPETTAESVGALQILRAARKRWMLVLFVVLATTSAALFYAFGRKTRYRSTATLLIDPNPPRPLGKDVEKVVDYEAYWSNKEYYETQVEIIQSRQIAGAVVRQLSLDSDTGFILELSQGVRPQTLVEVGVDDAVAEVRKRLSVEPQPKTRLLEVRFEDADPERARRVLSAVLNAYSEHSVGEVAGTAEVAKTWLHDQLNNLKRELEQSELALHQFKKNKSLLSVSFDDQSNMLREELVQLNSRLTEVRVQRQRILAHVAALQSVSVDDPSQLPASALLASPLLEATRNEYVGARRTRDSLLAAGRGERHPEVQAASESVAILKETLLHEVDNIKNGLRKDLEAIDIELKGLSGLMGGAETEALDLNLLEIEYNRLQRVKDNNEKMYGLVLERSTESDLASLMQVTNIRVLDAPLRGSPLGLSVPTLGVFGAFGGLLLGFAAALAREALDRSVKTQEDVEQELGLPLLALLPKSDGSDAGPYNRRGSRRYSGVSGLGASRIELAVHERPQSAIAEAARGLRTNILFSAPDRPHRTLLVTSPGPGEGKTTVATWIAIAMAQAGHRVILVDCDLRKPRIHRVFSRKVNQGVGVSEAVLDRSLLEGADLSSEVPNLDVLTAGARVPNPAELLGSERFVDLLRHLAQTYDRVVLDSPPVAAVTDATVLSTRVDGTVLVLRAFSTTREFARRATRAVRDVGGQLVGSVLNAVDTKRRGYRYYYQDGYYDDPKDIPVSATRRDDGDGDGDSAANSA